MKRWSVLALVLLLGSGALRAQTGGRAPQATPLFRADTELVLVNVVVRDRSGKVVRGLQASDFIVTEDDKAQSISSFDFEELDTVATAPPVSDAPPVLSRIPAARPTPGAPASAVAAPPVKVDMKGRRLIVLFFDLGSMQPEELTRAVQASHEYIEQKLSPADLMAVVSFSSALRLDQEFTADRERLTAAVDRFGGANAQGLDAGATGTSDGTADDGTAFTADDTEFNIFNTDRRLDALQTLSDSLSGIDQKKSVIYFSSGMSQSGQDNQIQLRRTVDRANRANVSIYAADMRGLQAIVPGGSASAGSTRGASAFSGATTRNQFDSLSASQDTLTTMAEDTGGRAFFDSNSFGDAFTRVVSDTSAYYVLGYSSTNAARDGRYRRIKVRLKDTSAKLEYRSGYYAPRDFAHSKREDRDQQLQDQLLSDLSVSDISAYVSTAYFRLSDNRLFVPMSVVVPGYQLPFARTTDKTHATVDVLGVVRDVQGRPVGRIRDTIRLAVETADELKRKTVQYETGMELAPGKYDVKVVVRENENGTMGSYETQFVVPDLSKAPIKLSSVVIGTQLQEGVRRNDRNPLFRNGHELIPSVTRVVSSGQHLYFYYEVYDPARRPAAAAGGPPAGVKVLTSISFFRGSVRAFETPLVEATELAGADGKAAVFQFDVPAASLPPGVYTCQVNVVDDVAGAFAFPRTQLLVRR